MNEGKIKDYYFNLKNIIYIEKDEKGNILNTNNSEILSYYDDIINSSIVEDNQYYYARDKKWFEIIKIDFYDEKTSDFHLIEYIEDITDIKDKFSKLKLDSLTGLMRNRDECNKLIEEYINNALINNEEFSILIGDIDYFKSINDTYGHHCGDLVLRRVSKCLLKCTKQSGDVYDYENDDIILRFGGDEFLILLKNSSLNETIDKIKEITSMVKDENIIYDNQNISIAMSFGYAHFNKDDFSSISASKIRNELSKKADENLYNVKKNRNH